MISISVIIPSFNQGQYLEDTICSLLEQHYNKLEIIVIDGGSSDDSVEIIRKYKDYISYWHSKKDNGQSDAINIGINVAKGEFVTWLNSDDVLLPGILEKISDFVESNPFYSWYLGNVLWLNQSGNVIRVGKVEKNCWFWNKGYLLSNGGPSAVMRKKDLMEIGLLREDFHYMMDTELWYRFIKNGHQFCRIPFYCWGLRLHERAKMSGHNFADSPLADYNHPSWQQKRKENIILNSEYHLNRFSLLVWRAIKLLNLSFYTRFSDRKYLGHHFTEINQDGK